MDDSMMDDSIFDAGGNSSEGYSPQPKQVCLTSAIPSTGLSLASLIVSNLVLTSASDKSQGSAKEACHLCEAQGSAEDS